MIIEKNFDWDITNRKLVIFMPNYNGRALTAYTISKIQTSVPDKDWIIIVGNDNVDDEFDFPNVYYFNIRRDTKEPRNGGFIRNYFIKNCKSDLILQKDGEVLLEGDFIKNAIDNVKEDAWRPKIIYVLDGDQTTKLLNNYKIEVSPTYVVNPPYISTYFHYAYCIQTNILQYLHGYDENYKYWGYEDTDLFDRLLTINKIIKPDPEISATHLSHHSTINYDQLKNMELYYNSVDKSLVIRNPNGWGEGE